MLKLVLIPGAAALAMLAPAAAAQAIGPDADACQSNSGRSAILVNVSGFKSPTGELRVQLYPGNSDFLAKGKWLRRIDLPVRGSAPMRVCLAVPKAGNYAVAVRHDTRNNGPDWNDGGGFSRNPKLTIFSYKPKVGDVAIPVGNGLKSIDVVLNYRRGLSIGPARS